MNQKQPQSSLRGLWLTTSSPTQAEYLARETGFEVFVVDNQHGALPEDDAVRLVQSLATTTTISPNKPHHQCWVRVSEVNDAEICRFLDHGATGIIAPMTNTPQEVRDFVASCYYPPHGRRSFGPHRSRLLLGSAFSTDNANSLVSSWAMIETKQALDNLDAILDIPGLTGVFVGPADLSISLGYPPTATPERNGYIHMKIKEIGRRARAKGKKVGLFCNDVERARETLWVDEFDFVSIATDYSMLVNAAKTALRGVERGRL